MKPPLKFTLYSILYISEEGIWEHEIYKQLKKHYNARALSKLRSLLIELVTKNWIEETEEELYGDNILRKYKLQNRHREFIEYQLKPNKILADLGIENIILEEGEELYGPKVVGGY